MYIKLPSIVFDPQKDQLNLEKHGVSLSLANHLEWSTLWMLPDERQDYGESRFIGYAIMNNRLYCVVFTDRDDYRRIISLRKANTREVKAYVANT